MNEAVVNTAADESKDEPSASLTDRQVDQIMTKLIEQAMPNEQARLKEMDRETQHRLAETYLSQEADRHIEDEAAKGNAILGH
ncbi:MAG: hypothetical protein GXY55_19600 [Phycisphaerae bacterium]|nr:hypothetical protein [Phycisphaerae bacterium]